MNKESIAEVLKSLASGKKNRPEIALLRDVFDEVEEALSAGVSRTAILDALHKQGFTMTLKTFDNAIYRIRKQKRVMTGLGVNPLTISAQENLENASSNAVIDINSTLGEATTGSHNPADLAKILSTPVDLDALSRHAKRNKNS